MTSLGSRTALVTGGNRGIGLAACRQLARAGLRVILTARDSHRGREATALLKGEGLDVAFEPMDVGDRESVASCLRRLSQQDIIVDVLVNNAGIFPSQDILRVDVDMLDEVLAVHVVGPFRLCRALLPTMIERGYGRIVNVSSGLGAVCDQPPAAGVYGVSKASLNALTRSLAASVRGDVKVNALHPGWVRTEMGGAGAPVSPEEAAASLVWLATLPADGPNGGFFFNRRSVAW